MAVIPLLVLPLVWNLGEVRDKPVASTGDQCREIWTTVCSRAVWQPNGFFYLFNALQVPNAAWRQFLVSYLGFSANELNALLIVAYAFVFLGVLAYKSFFLKWSWRTVYILTTLIGGGLSALQLLLIRGITFGISPFWFSFGDEVFAEFTAGMQLLPTTIIAAQLCPDGSEGASYAMFTTIRNAAITLSSALGTLLLPIWDVRKETLRAGHLSGLTKLTIFTTAMQMFPILFVGWLPRYKDELMKLKGGSSRLGGAIFLGITFTTVAYSVIVGVMNIVSPGWEGES